MATAQDVINLARYQYPSIPSTGTVALDLLQIAHNRILGAVRLRATEEVDLSSLVAGTGEYALSDDIIRVWSAVYMTNATEATPLTETSLDILDQERVTWRFDQNGTPERWYDLGAVVGLYPKPDRATTSGYPRVRLYVTKRQTLAVNTVMPAMVPSYDAWVALMCREWALINDRDGYPFWDDRAKSEEALLIERIQGRQPRLKPSLNANVPRVSNF